MQNNQSDNVRVRFAPSPTGFLHVGGARTAIFNWLYARHSGGKFLLRIEDTDPERSKGELSEQILRSMKWLGMDADEPIVYQALNGERHREIAYALLESGKAYRAFETAEELEEQRKQSQANKIPFKYNRASLKLDKDTIEKYLAEGRPYAIRFKVPEGVTEFEDIVHGKTVFNNNEIDDFVILRSDGSPVYMIAVVVDDNDMGITHVIRGDDHLSNTPKQIMLYNAMGWNVPEFAHLPMILDETKKKLSKRRNPVSVEEYKSKGYLPEAMFNFLTLLGYAPLNNREIISKEETIAEFTFDRVNKKSAVFDMKKLGWINSQYIKSADENRLAQLLIENNPGINKDDPAGRLYILSVIRLMKERVSTIRDFAEFGSYFFTEPETYDAKGMEKHWNAEIKEKFKKYAEQLEGLNEWTPALLEENLRNFAETENIKAAQLIHPLRLAITGITISPGIFELMEVLGKTKVTGRLRQFLTN
jgi:glutamyl-tRNA synthetase